MISLDKEKLRKKPEDMLKLSTEANSVLLTGRGIFSHYNLSRKRSRQESQQYAW
jgi:hypothetical protein